jgi:hypothetical protein
MQASTYAIDAMVDNLFRVSQLNRDEFHRKAKLGVKSTFDAYVQPYTMTDAERSLSTGLRNIMSTPCELGGALPPLNIGLNSRVSVVLSIYLNRTLPYKLYTDQFLPSLHLEVPKKVIQYVPAAVPVVDPSKAKQAKAKVTRGPQRQFKPAKSALPEVASIYAEGHDSDADQPASKRARVSLGKSNGEEEARRPVAAAAEVAHEKINRRAIPANFYTVVAPLFKEFWEMEFDSDEVTYAFFARITNLNAKDFKLNAFAERSYCLEVIKVCIQHTATAP